jgi:hypothetical protein
MGTGETTNGGAAGKPRSILRLAVTMPAAGFLILLMAIGSVFLWLGIPLGLIYLASQTVDSSQPTLGPYIALLFGIPLCMVIFGKLLFQLDRVFERITGRESEADFRAPWLKSMRGDTSKTRKLTVLEGTMIVSVSLAVLAFGVWFLLFAGSSLPGS